ncbi:MAG: GH15 family glucan-1,4-alpha-glucosidase, partial [Algoriphagus sp.]
MTKHTYDSGLIGNCAFIAHVEKNTNISWLCFPRFDSDFIFGGMVDRKKGGEFTILPDSGEFHSEQVYLENTNILKTTITQDGNSYQVTDFAPRFKNHDRYYKPLMLIRKIECVSGSPRIKISCQPVTNRGQNQLVPSLGSNHIRFMGIDQELRLTSNAPLSYIQDSKPFALHKTIYLVLTYGRPLEAAVETTSERFLLGTKAYWQEWVKSTSISGFHQKLVLRSALILKIHQYEDTGAIIAAS